MEETRKHKSVYFGQKAHPDRASRTEAVRDGATEAADIDMSDDEKPIPSVNFLFSNDIDSDETNDDCDEMS